MRIKLIQSNQSEMVSYFHENLNKQIGAVAQTVYTDVYGCLQLSVTQASSNLFFVFYHPTEYHITRLKHVQIATARLT